MKKPVLMVLILILLTGSAAAADKVRMSISAVDVSFLTAGVALKRGIQAIGVKRRPQIAQGPLRLGKAA